MKVLFFHRWVGVHGGGTETHLKELAVRFADLGHRVAILTRDGKELKNLPREIRVLRISKNRNESDHSYEDSRVYWHTALFMIKALWRLLRLRLSGLQPDIISVHFYTEAVVARLFRFLTHTPYIFILEGYTELEAKEAKRANACIAISEYEARRCYADFGFRPEVIPIGVDLARFTPRGLSTKEMIYNKFKVLTVCRLESRKDLKTLIEAAELLQTNDKIHFYLAGTGIDEGKIRHLVEDKKLKNFTLLGYLPDDQLPRFYRTASVFILPTFEEGFGIVLVEAMASGTAVISNPVGSVPEVAGKAAILVKNRDPRALADAIVKLTDVRRRTKLEKAGLERAVQFDWNKIILQYANAYQRVAKTAS